MVFQPAGQGMPAPDINARRREPTRTRRMSGRPGQSVPQRGDPSSATTPISLI